MGSSCGGGGDDTVVNRGMKMRLMMIDGSRGGIVKTLLMEEGKTKRKRKLFDAIC